MELLLFARPVRRDEVDGVALTEPTVSRDDWEEAARDTEDGPGPQKREQRLPAEGGT